MLSFSLVRNIFFLLVGGLVVFFFIRPTYAEIQQTQTTIEELKKHQENISEYNGKVGALLDQIASIKKDDKDRLTTFLPTKFDHVQVGRDILNIAVDTKMRVNSISVGIDDEDTTIQNQNTEEDDQAPLQRKPVNPATDIKSYDIALSLGGGYEDFKNFLQAIENNSYPLYVKNLQISPPIPGEQSIGGGLEFTFGVTLKTFILAKQSSN